MDFKITHRVLVAGEDAERAIELFIENNGGEKYFCVGHDIRSMCDVTRDELLGLISLECSGSWGWDYKEINELDMDATVINVTETRTTTTLLYSNY